MKPEITSPANGSTVEGPIVTISGKATPGYRVVAHNNPTEELMECVSTYGIMANGLADSNGDFEFDLTGVCERDMEVFVSAVDLEESELEDCIGEDSISELTKFAVSGELHGICFM